MEQSHKITLNIVMYGNRIEHITLDENDSVSRIHEHFPYALKNFVFKDQMLLLPFFSLRFYNIHDGDTLYLAQFIELKNPYEIKPKKLLGLFNRDYNVMMGFMRESDPELVLEHSRKKDQQFLKIEGSYSIHNKLMTSFKNSGEKTPNLTNLGTNIEWDNIEGPSTEGLPFIFSSQ